MLATAFTPQCSHCLERAQRHLRDPQGTLNLGEAAAPPPASQPLATAACPGAFAEVAAHGVCFVCLAAFPSIMSRMFSRAVAGASASLPCTADEDPVYGPAAGTLPLMGAWVILLLWMLLCKHV